MLAFGAIAQLGERDVCNVEVAGSSPAGSIRLRDGVVEAESNALSERSESKGKPGAHPAAAT